jgi:transcriptional regulator with XRE-family HTH domain
MPSKPNQPLRPQKGKRLREYRIHQHLRQEEFVDLFNDYLKKIIPDLPAANLLTQSMLSDLERDKAVLSITHWLALSQFLTVDPLELLSERIQKIYNPSPLITVETQSYHHHTAPDHTNQALFKVYSTFPAPHFACEACFNHLPWIATRLSEHIEFYNLRHFIDFLFSPTGNYTNDEKLQILQRMHDYFSRSMYQRIYFTPALQHSSTPALQHSSTPALQHSSTPALQHSSTPALQHSSTPALIIRFILI